MSKAASTRLANQQRLVMQWNALYSVGTEVTVMVDFGEAVCTRTTSPAQMAKEGSVAFVYLANLLKPYSLSRVRPIPKP